jgi:hypothetical protein
MSFGYQILVNFGSAIEVSIGQLETCSDEEYLTVVSQSVASAQILNFQIAGH